MSNKTNEEKLRILHERLDTIQKKKESKQQEIIDQSKPITPVFKEDLVNKKNIEPISSITSFFKKFKVPIILFLSAFIIGFIAKTLINKGYIVIDTEFEFSTQKNYENEDNISDDIIYNKESFNGNFIIVLNSFNDINKANSEVLYLSNKGYQCDVLQLSGVSNSIEEIYQTYIGSFDKKEEASQYFNSTELISSSGQIIELQ